MSQAAEGKTAEVRTKLALIRASLERNGLAAVRLRGADWFAWATAGGSNVVILTSETGVAEVLVTPRDAYILTDVIEADRIREEESPGIYELWASPWAELRPRQAFIQSAAGGGRIASDRPGPGEVGLPAELISAKRRLLPQEIERYRTLGREASIAMSETLRAATPDWTEYELAAEGSRALWRRGIHPTLTLVGGEARLPRHRHATASSTPLGRRAMLVFCARRWGLYANLTRFVYFEPPSSEERKRILDVARIEAVAFSCSRPGRSLSDVYGELASAYSRQGYPEEILKHHQGGTTGYLSREIVATPETPDRIESSTALAWNPSLPGAKIEDTILATQEGIEILTEDPEWPCMEVDGRKRPDVWVKA